MAAALAGGGQVLLLLPEIALTAGFLTRVETRFGCEPAQWHSDVRPRERERVWRGVAERRGKNRRRRPLGAFPAVEETGAHRRR